LVVVTGEPGIGKTALARVFADRAAARGASSAWGTCWDGGGAPALWPWVQIVRTLARHEDAVTLREGLGDAGPWIAGLLPELAGTLGPPAKPSDLNADQARFRLYDALASLLATVAGRRPLVVVLDDLHWADTSSVLALEFLGRTLPDLPILALAAYRHSEAHARQDLAAALGGIARAATRLPLEGLGRDDVRRLAIARAHGLGPGTPAAIAPELVAAVHHASAGNPFFVDELLQLLASQGRLHDDHLAPDPLPLPHGVRETIRRRLAPLDEPSMRTLRAAAVIGGRFRLGTLARVVGDSPAAILEHLEAPLRDGLVTAGGGRRHFSFVHSLVRDTLISAIGATERARLHLRTAEALEQLYADDVEPHLAEIAHHFLQGASAGGAQRAVEFAARAAQRAIGQFAYDEAARLYGRAIEVAAALPADELRAWELHHGLGEALMRSGDVEGSHRALRNAVEHARNLDDPTALGQTALARALPGFSAGLVEPELVAIVEEALARLDASRADDPARRAVDDALRCRLRVQLALALYWSPQPERREQLVAEALVLARAIFSGEPAQHSLAQRALADRTLAFALAQGFLAAWGPETVERGLPISVEALELCERTNDVELAMQIRLWRISLLLELDDPVRADAEIEAYGAAARRLGQPRTLVYDPLHRAMRAHMRGEFAAAERFTAEAAGVADDVRRSMAPMIADAQTFLLRRSQGRHHDLEPLVRGNADRRPAMRRWRCALALLLAEIGRVDEAQKELDQLAEGDFESLPRDASWLLSVSLLAELCTLLGDRPRARCLYGLLAPYEGRNVVAMGAAYYGPVARFLGLLAMTIGEDERALGHLETARSAAQRMGALPTVVLTALDAAEMLVRRDAPGDAERATALVQSVTQEAERLRMRGALARMADLRERLTKVGEREAPLAAPRAVVARLSRQHDVWLLDYDGRSVCLQDAKGLRYLAKLLGNPGTPIAAVALAAAGGASPLDLEAQRARVAELREEIAEARAFNDPERAARAGAQLEALAGELAAAGEHEGAPGERARVNVTRAIRAALRRIAAHEPELGHRLQRTIRTGSHCLYRPDPDPPLQWEIRA
ncbi:MAG: eukaryotic-like serine/threonine-protein kinase, partial [Solirubrobacteraceae bacterium]|nr:eukaryotic-like serine/threonine-protein kinase [Solirubrobacteraceae bacterium]